MYPAESGSKKNSVTPILEEWCQVTGWHGILDLYFSKQLFLKMSWAAVILFGVFMTVNQCVGLILDFQSSDQWVTSITYEKEHDLAWPNITICNLDKMFHSTWENGAYQNETYLIPYLAAYISAMGYDADDNIQFYDKYQAPVPRYQDSVDLEKLKNTIKESSVLTFISNRSLSEVIKYTQPSCNQTLLHCGPSETFDLRNQNPCCDNSESVQTDRDYTCLTVFTNNSLGKIAPAKVNNQGLYFLFNPRTTDYLRSLIKNEKGSAGLKVSFHFGPKDTGFESTILLSPGTHTSVSLMKEKHRYNGQRSKSTPLSNTTKPCIEKYQYKHILYDKYTTKLCAKDCVIGSSLQTCKCNVLVGMGVETINAPVCLGAAILPCLNWLMDCSIGKIARPDAINIWESFNKCMEQCQEACDYDKIETKLSTAIFPAPVKVQAMTTYMNRALGLNYSEDETRQLILLAVNYENKEQQKVIEKYARTSIDELISNLGGALGVWTGLSMLSFYQCAVYAMKGIWAIVDNRKPTVNVKQILH